VTASSSVNPADYAQSVTITANVSSLTGTPTGNILFSVDGGTPQSVALSSGSAPYTLPTLRPGAHTVTVTYPAQNGYAAGSATLAETINAPTGNAPVADLQATGLSVVPASPQSGNTVTLKWNDSNTGTASTLSGWSDSIVVRYPRRPGSGVRLRVYLGRPRRRRDAGAAVHVHAARRGHGRGHVPDHRQPPTRATACSSTTPRAPARPITSARCR